MDTYPSKIQYWKSLIDHNKITTNKTKYLFFLKVLNIKRVCFKNQVINLPPHHHHSTPLSMPSCLFHLLYLSCRFSPLQVLEKIAYMKRNYRNPSQGRSNQFR